MAIIQAENSAFIAEACPILLAIAPKNLALESLKTIPIAPQGETPIEEPSQLILTTLGGVDTSGLSVLYQLFLSEEEC